MCTRTLAASSVAVCRKCGVEKPAAEFVWQNDSGQEGVAGRCRECRMPGWSHRDCPDCESSRRRCAVHAKALNPFLPAPRFHIRRHALERFRERVRPDLDSDRVAVEVMIRLMVDAPHVFEPPQWLGLEGGSGRPHHAGWLLVMPTVAFCLSTYGSFEYAHGSRQGWIRVATVVTADDAHLAGRQRRAA